MFQAEQAPVVDVKLYGFEARRSKRTGAFKAKAVPKIACHSHTG
jgi:hypothetical protein